jgi:signal transduction histidine kinase
MRGPDLRLPSGLRGRFLLAFGAISALAVFAAAWGVVALLLAQHALEDAAARRMPETIGAMGLSGHAERLAAIGPALAGTTAADAVSALTATKNTELAAARRQLRTLRSEAGASTGLTAIGIDLERLSVNLDETATAVMRRNAAAVEKQALLRNALRASQAFSTISAGQFRRLQHEVTALRRGDETPRFGPQAKPNAAGRFAEPAFEPAPPDRLLRRFGSVFRLLVAATETEDAMRLAQLKSDSEADLRDIDALVTRLDGGAAAMLPAIALLRQSTLGAEGLFTVRKSELDAAGETRRLIAENTGLAGRLSSSVDAVVALARQHVDAAARRALVTQRVESFSLAVIAAASLVCSVLIVWLYVGRNIVLRLTRLSAAMSAMAGGRLDVAVDDQSGDEIGTMGRAVEVFRRHAIERDWLRAERERLHAERTVTAQRLERLVEVEDRTAQLARNEAALRVMFDNMHQGVAMFDRDLTLVAWNQPFCDLLQLPDRFLQGRPSFDDFFRLLGWRGEFGPGDTEKKLAHSRAAVDRPLFEERTRRDGSTLEIRRQPIGGGGFVSMYADITERKRAEAEIRAARDAAEAALTDLRRAQARLIQAEKMASLGQLTAGIAHEIKNPLNFVNNFAALSVELLDELKETAAPAIALLGDEKHAEVDDVIGMLTGNLEKIAEHGRRADGIVKSMLDHSRGSTGERQSVDINALVDEALNLAYHGARARDGSFDITLERDFDPTIAPIEVVPQDLSRVFVNLINNGFYAATSDSRGATVRPLRPSLRVTTRDRFGNVEIRVRDNGVGIPEELRDKLFQPFFTTKPTGEGTGLGLSISYDIVVQEHGGTIGVDSRPGEFTEFIVCLPRDRRAAVRGTDMTA